MEENTQTRSMPVVPLRGMAVLPGEVIHVDIGRPKTLHAIEQAITGDGFALFCAQMDPKPADIGENDFEHTGTVCKLRQAFKIQGETLRLLVTGVRRAAIRTVTDTEPCFRAEVEYLCESEPVGNLRDALRRKLEESFDKYARQQNRLTAEQRENVLRTEGFGAFTDAVGRNVATKLTDKQALIAETDAGRRAYALMTLIEKETVVLGIEQTIAGKVKSAVDANQRDFVLREQLRAVKEELGEAEDDIVSEYRARMERKTFPEAVRKKLEKEIGRFESLPRGSHEQPMMQAYIECILDLPWTERSEDDLDLGHARAVLDAGHYGMEKIKKRIIEMLAVQKLTGNPQGQILCLIGPPGVGKTSIASAIAEAMGRKFIRMSLGGVHDEAEIRGHRRTYIGAQPGRVIDAMRRAGTVNPLLLFDEIDKLSASMNGDPSAAMLEVLDSAQNSTFADHFLELPYDLSQCTLMTTANDADRIPGPLRDRMEMIEVPGYLFSEKMEIAKLHLLPRQMAKNGLKKSYIRFDDRAMERLIDGYTREAGVRQLERELGSVCRKAACEIVDGKKRVTVSANKLTEWLGPVKFRREPVPVRGRVGEVTGLAWTAVGGETLDIETAVMPGKGQLQLTGQLGDVMQESAKAALTYIRAHANEYGIPQKRFETSDVHIHVPEGAIPKDGPSAGIAMMTALMSAFSGIPVRAGIAMTGEITLLGHVLPIGGLREKLLAAVQAGVHTVLLPEKNRESLFDVPAGIKEKLDIRFVRNADEVLREAIEHMPLPLGETAPETGKLPLAVEAGVYTEGDSHGSVCH